MILKDMGLNMAFLAQCPAGIVRKIKIPHLLELFEKKEGNLPENGNIYQKEKTCTIDGKRKSGDGG